MTDLWRGEQTRKRFSIEAVKQGLAMPPRLQELPAMAILERQFRLIAERDQEKERRNPSTPLLDQAMRIMRTFAQPSLYARFTEELSDSSLRSESDAYIASRWPAVQKEWPLVQALLERDLNPVHIKIMKDKKDRWRWLFQRDLKQVKYRLYLAPRLSVTMGLFHEIAKAMPQEAAYTMKTLSPNLMSTPAIARVDKVVLYLGDQSLPAALRVLETIAHMHPTWFQDRPVPAGAVYVLAPGMGVSYNPPHNEQDQSQSATGVIARSFEARLEHTAQRHLAGTARTSAQGETFSHSLGARLLWESLVYEEKEPPQLRQLEWLCVGNDPRISTEVSAQLTQLLFQAIYSEWVAALGQGRPIIAEHVHLIFLDLVSRGNLPQKGLLGSRIQGRPLEQLVKLDLNRTVKFATIRAGLAANIYKSLHDRTPVVTALHRAMQE